MSHLWSLIDAHQVILGIGAFWIYCAAVDSMPEPAQTSGTGYRFWYAFLHKLAGNLSVAFASKIPGVKP